MQGSHVTADRSTPSRVAGVGRRQGYDQHSSRDLGDHQPMRRRDRREEERIGRPHLAGIIEAEHRVLEQVRCLVIDLEGILVVESVEIEPTIHLD